MTLDLAVAAAVAQSRRLECALHSQAPWYFDLGGVRVLAERTIHGQGVTFRGCFTSNPANSDVLSLYEGDVLRSARPFNGPTDGGFCIEWDLSLEEKIST